ncbi:MAG TPA: MFS transporter [Thermoplasmata archaeon]|nr:MFS transporter [Thermoplasmata archaeon]
MSGTTPKLGFRSVLRNRQYLLWLVSADSATVGYTVYAISIVWLTYTVTHSYLLIGVVLFVEYATYSATFLIAPFADRVANQRTIYLVCYPIQAAAALTLGLAAYRGFLSVPLLLGLIVLISFLWDLAWAAYQAAPRLLLSPDELFAAEGVGGVIGGANSIAGYASGGVLIVLVGAGGGMYLYAALLALGAILALPLAIHPGPPSDENFRESFRTGWRALLSEPGHGLLQLASVDAVQAFFTSGVALFITLVSVTVFTSSSAAYGVLFTTYVIGGVAAGLVLGWANPRRHVGIVMVVSLAATGVAFVAVGAVPALLVLSAFVWLLVGVTSTGYATAKYAFIRGSVEPTKLARVSGNMYLFPGITSAVGALVLGALADHVLPVAFGLTLGAGFLAAGLLASLLPGVKALRF